MQKLLKVNNIRYEVLGTVSVKSKYSPEELKIQWKADTVLRNGNKLYMTRKLIDAEFRDLN